MSAMNQAIKLPEIQAAMMNMSREMQRAGLIEEVMSETMESLDRPSNEESKEKVRPVGPPSALLRVP